LEIILLKLGETTSVREAQTTAPFWDTWNTHSSW